MKTKLVAVIALIFCAFMAEASKVEGNGNIITKEISVDNYSEIELGHMSPLIPEVHSK